MTENTSCEISNAICLYCGKTFEERDIGDHIIPQGLGRFRPEYTLKNVCKECDENHGGDFEQIVLRTGMIGLFRKIYRIQSKNSRKKKRRPRNPTLDRYKTIEHFTTFIKSRNNENEKLYIDDDGRVCSANIIRVYKAGAEIDRIYIPPSRSVRQTCEFIQSQVVQNEFVTFKIEIHTEDCINVLNELRRRGYEFGEILELERVDEIIQIEVTSLITENHFKFICNIALKAMFASGLSLDLICPLIDYVQYGTKPSVFIPKANVDKSKEFSIDNPELNEFSHKVGWAIESETITVFSDLMSHQRVHGLNLSLRITAGKCKKLINNSFGSIEAKYSGRGTGGTLQILSGESPIPPDQIYRNTMI